MANATAGFLLASFQRECFEYMSGLNKEKIWWPGGARGRNAAHKRLEEWFKYNSRNLPWRKNRSPWRSLVSEFMLQQTQVARVSDRFESFMKQFPTPGAMVNLGEEAVLAAWSGLGYYRRAKFLFRASEKIVTEYQGKTPVDLEQLIKLPGVGRYTAGAIASIAAGKQVPIVDGNVSRVFMRMHGREGSVDERSNVNWVWDMANDFVHSSKSPGVSNEALMELGAICCKPQSVSCSTCPFVKNCIAYKSSNALKIPSPKKKVSKKTLFFESIGVFDNKGRILLSRRSSGGLWSGIWEPITFEVDHFSTKKAHQFLKDKLSGIGLTISFGRLSEVGFVNHQTSHRNIEVRLLKSEIVKEIKCSSKDIGFYDFKKLKNLPLGSIQRKMIKVLYSNH